jgi:isochorismate hydrolase
MKEKYFDKNNISEQAKDFIDSLPSVIRKLPNNLLFDSSALLVMDMQGFFLKSDSHAYIPSAEAIIPNILKLQKFFLKKNNLVIQTKHVNTLDNAGKMNKWWGHLMTRDNPLIRITPELHDMRVMVLEKNQYDAFYKTNLLEILLDKKIKHLFITGVMAHLCCETTARSAFVRGFEVFFVVDGTATYNRDFHRATLLNLSHGFAIPLMSCDIMDAFK